MRGAMDFLLLLALCPWGAKLGHAQSSAPTPSSTACGNSCPCAPRDAAGTAHDKTTFVANGGAGRVICHYPSAGACNYFRTNGTLASGVEACPASLAVLPSSDSPTSTSASSTTSQTLQLPPNTQLPTGVSQRHQLSAAQVAGIAVGVLSVLAVIAVFLLFKRRRKHTRARLRSEALSEIENNRAAATISPFPLISQINAPTRKNAARASTIGRQELETQLLEATEKMVGLQDQEGVSVGGIASVWRSVSGRFSSTAPDLEVQLQTARDQIDLLVTRINALEANSESGWSRVVVNESPPEYH